MNGSRDEFLKVLEAADVAKLRELLAAQPELVRERTPEGQSAILFAQYRLWDEVVQALLEAQPELDVFEAAAVGRRERVAELVDAAPDLVGARSDDGFTALHLAAFFGRADVTRLLLERGAEVAAPSRNMMRVSPLHSAVAGRNVEIAEMLLSAGAGPNARQQGGWTPLHAAAEGGDVAMATLLLSGGAEPDVENEQGKTPLEMAAGNGHEGVAALLRKATAGSSA